jgi:hypothetical protein
MPPHKFALDHLYDDSHSDGQGLTQVAHRYGLKLQ